MIDSEHRHLPRRIAALNGNSLAVLAAVMNGQRTGRQPSYAELGKLIGSTSKNGVAFHIRRLRKLGLLLEQVPQRKRCFETACRFIPAAKLEE